MSGVWTAAQGCALSRRAIGSLLPTPTGQLLEINDRRLSNGRPTFIAGHRQEHRLFPAPPQGAVRIISCIEGSDVVGVAGVRGVPQRATGLD